MQIAIDSENRLMEPQMTAPEIPRLPAFATSGGRCLCTFKSHWDKDLKQPRRTSTKTVGRLVPAEGREGVMEVIFKEEFEKLCPGLERFRVFRHKGGKLDFEPRHKRLKHYMPMPPLGVRGRHLGLVMREVSEEGEDLAAKASSCLGRGLGFVMRASIEGALGLKPIPGWMRPALSDFNACQPCLGARGFS